MGTDKSTASRARDRHAPETKSRGNTRKLKALWSHVCQNPGLQRKELVAWEADQYGLNVSASMSTTYRRLKNLQDRGLIQSGDPLPGAAGGDLRGIYRTDKEFT